MTIPVRDLHLHWHVARSTAYSVRRLDPLYRANVTEFDVGGILQITEEDNARYLDARRAAAAAAKVVAAKPRKPGRPRRLQLDSTVAV